MIAFSVANVLDPDVHYDVLQEDSPVHNYLLSVCFAEGYCISKALVTETVVPCYLTIITVFDSQADIVAIPELHASVYVPWRQSDHHRTSETAFALQHAGLTGKLACCVAIAVDIIYQVIDRDYVDCAGTAKNCIFTSSGVMELNSEAREKIFCTDHVISNYTERDDIVREPFEKELPF